MDFFDELIEKLKEEALKNSSSDVSPEEWDKFLHPEKHPSESPMMEAAPEKTEIQAESVFDITALQQNIAGCRECPLCKVRKNPALSYGDAGARLMIVVENPSLLDDEENQIFAGEVGILLDKMLSAMGLQRKDTYITAIVKCRTPGSRPPSEDEVKCCTEKFFKAEVKAVHPECILAFGAGFAKDILHREGMISALRGNFDSYDGIPVMSTFNPAYLLRQPSAKKIVWNDLQMVMKALGLK